MNLKVVPSCNISSFSSLAQLCPNMQSRQDIRLDAISRLRTPAFDSSLAMSLHGCHRVFLLTPENTKWLVASLPSRNGLLTLYSSKLGWHMKIWNTSCLNTEILPCWLVCVASASRFPRAPSLASPAPPSMPPDHPIIHWLKFSAQHSQSPESCSKRGQCPVNAWSASVSY